MSVGGGVRDDPRARSCAPRAEPARALTPPLTGSPLRAAISAATRPPEADVVPALLDSARLRPADAAATDALALRLARGVRERSLGSGRAGLVQGLLQEFALSSQEGVALMCLAEALLRIPDVATRDALIRDKIARGNWQQHLGQSPSLFVNAATWGLLVTGRLIATHSERGLGSALARIVGRGGEPLIRRSVDMAMRLMGEQFVTGETIGDALATARRREAEGFRYSYDMLGEAAMTADDAAAYLASYESAIEAIGRASAGRGVIEGPGISVKLSALHPRYSRAQVERVRHELYPRLLCLATLAKRHDIGLNIDAEEADRLELSLDLLERLCFEPDLAGWNGIGFVIQAYQKRCPAVVDWLVDLALRSDRRLMVRLVKGAYWDSEIKRAQQDGHDGYPVYTRKAYTDVAYLACAKRLLAAPGQIYPQFATHNAHTLAAIHTMAGPERYGAGQYEFQCLHGMGEPLYEQVVGSPKDGKLGRPCRIYAPVGMHDTLLAYLVRRLLENGANTSFVNRVASDDVPLETLVEDPTATVDAMAVADGAVGVPHPSIPLPRDLYGAARRNSRGLDLASETTLTALESSFRDAAETDWRAAPMLGLDLAPSGGPRVVRNPANHEDIVGEVVEANAADVDAALAGAAAGAGAWAATSPGDRASCLEGAADRLDDATGRLVPLLVRESGKTCANAASEIREAIDFLRYYAAEVRRDFDNATHVALGPVVCISPWNFPLAIFVGQVSAALAAGNVVLAKPAEQTPLVAAEAVRALWAAGVPRSAVQLLPGDGTTVGAALVADARVQGVLFTGSTDVARILQRSLAERLDRRGEPVVLVAETGGQNAMVVDSSALAEQVTADVIASAFDSAGQRCSALRVLCVQRDLADRLVPMLEGAVRELAVGDTRRLATDIGPVIDAEAQHGIERHVSAMRTMGRRVTQPTVGAADAAVERQNGGTFVAPTLIEIDSIGELEREVFGPVLHMLRYDRDALPELLRDIDATGYGLTLGVHSRIDETVARVVATARVGNVYVNRNVVGAVVGVQPFGGEGLSGTGPKAGGPLYLLRLLVERPVDAMSRAVAAAAMPALPSGTQAIVTATDATLQNRALPALRRWAQTAGWLELAVQCDELAARSPSRGWQALTGPTGEADLYALCPREAVLCLADADADVLLQLAAVLAVGGRAVWPAGHLKLRETLPDGVRDRIALAGDWTSEAVRFDTVLHHGDAATRLPLAQQLARRAGPIIGLVCLEPGDTRIPLERLLVERSISINTAAAGGNASLMTIG